MDLILTAHDNRKTNKAKKTPLVEMSFICRHSHIITQAHHAHKTMDQCVKLQNSNNNNKLHGIPRGM